MLRKQTGLVCLCLLAAGILNIQNVHAQELPHLEESILPELRISADIDIPEEFADSMAETVKIRRKTFTAEQVMDILWEGKTTKEKFVDDGYEAADIGEYEIATFYGEDDSFMDVGGSQLIFYESLYNNLANAVKTNPLTDEYNLNKFTAEDLSFMTRDECVGNVMSLLSQLGVTVSPDIHCYALDSETLQKEEIVVDIDGERHREQEKGIWTSEDECYYIQFTQEFNGVPVFADGYGDYVTGNGFPRTNIEVIYGAKGLIYLNIASAYETLDGTEKSETIQTLDDLKEQLKKKYDLLICNGQDQITDIKMQYLPCDSGNYESIFIPAWVLQMERPLEGMDDYVTTMIFNAITGKELF